MSKKHGQLTSRRGAEATPGRLKFSEDAIQVTPDGAIAIDASKLETPANVYDADFAWVQQRLGAVNLFFAKADLNAKDRLRTRLELRYPVEGFIEHFWKNSRNFHKIIRESVQRLPVAAVGERPPIESWEALKDHSEWVNFSYLARVGSQSALDFFNLAVPGFSRLPQTSQAHFQRPPIAMPWLRSMAATALAVSAGFYIPSSPAVTDARLAPHAVVAQREFADAPLLSPELRENADRARSPARYSGFSLRTTSKTPTTDSRVP